MPELENTMQELRVLESRGKDAQTELINLDNAVNQINTALLALRNLEKTTGTKETIIPIGAGVSVRAKIAKPGQVLVEVGAGIVVEKSLKKTQELLKEKASEIQLVRKKIERELQNISERAQFLNKKASKLIEKRSLEQQK